MRALTNAEWRGIAFLGGILLLGYGCWLVLPAAGFIAAGLLLCLAIHPLRKWFG